MGRADLRAPAEPDPKAQRAEGAAPNYLPPPKKQNQ
ncbi:hypothetical protein SGRA_3315 [Saprospira grandis str. Lewin]|uniref:Uncharacterized protein n=1 Tax=Saprospira grandis (strain Lewin) TaxID=984262 RepID=H6L035_SAPGL|nr:hypothetical protein SGRA_3315 [Saprospira grandis str. Lewin]